MTSTETPSPESGAIDSIAADNTHLGHPVTDGPAPPGPPAAVVNSSESPQSRSGPAQDQTQRSLNDPPPSAISSLIDRVWTNIHEFRPYRRFRKNRNKPELEDSEKSSEDNDFMGIVTVAYDQGDKDITRCGAVLFDSGSEDDMLSEDFASRFGFKGSAPYEIARTLNNHPLLGIGVMSARWYVQPRKSRLPFKSRKAPVSQHRFLPTEFIVVPSDNFDVIIGRRTITKYQLFKPNKLVAAHRLKIKPSKNVDEETKLAEKRREQEAKKRDEHEKEKKKREQEKK